MNQVHVLPPELREKICRYHTQNQLKEREKMGWRWVHEELLAPLLRFIFPIFYNEGWSFEQ